MSFSGLIMQILADDARADRELMDIMFNFRLQKKATITRIRQFMESECWIIRYEFASISCHDYM